MNFDYSPTPSSPLTKFNFILNKLADDERNSDLDEAIISWCMELSLEKDFPKISQEIIENKNLWIKHITVFDITLQLYRKLLVVTDKKIMGGFGNSFDRLKNISKKDFYHNVKETRIEMNTKSIIFIAFIFTGIGFLLYWLNKKNSDKNLQANIRSNTHYNHQTLIKEKCILALLIKSDRYQELIDSLEKDNFWQTEEISKLYGATQGLWIGSKSKFDNSQIKQELINCNPVNSTSEYDVHFVTIELDSNDSRFHPDVNQMDRRDAFIELGKRSPQITVSPRLSCKAYENTEFYSR
jgi:preprotein translocase subunit SecG